MARERQSEAPNIYPLGHPRRLAEPRVNRTPVPAPAPLAPRGNTSTSEPPAAGATGGGSSQPAAAAPGTPDAAAPPAATPSTPAAPPAPADSTEA